MNDAVFCTFKHCRFNDTNKTAVLKKVDGQPSWILMLGLVTAVQVGIPTSGGAELECTIMPAVCSDVSLVSFCLGERCLFRDKGHTQQCRQTPNSSNFKQSKSASGQFAFNQRIHHSQPVPRPAPCFYPGSQSDFWNYH